MRLFNHQTVKCQLSAHARRFAQIFAAAKVTLISMRRTVSRNEFYRIFAPLALLPVLLLSACDGAAVQLCGDYACVRYQNSCQSNIHVNCRTTLVRQCESAGSIRDRAPRIISELREAERACGINSGQSDSGQSSSSQSSTNSNSITINDSVSDNRLLWDESLVQVSEVHARDMANNGFESFVGTNGLTTSERVQLAGINSALVTESIDSGQQTSAEVINTWLDIPTDCAQLLNVQTTRIGMACAVPNSGNSGPYWSLLLAGPEPQ